MSVTKISDASGNSVKLIAFYLTQFHPTPENDVWWGRGFTEWTNVTKAKPLFDGHYQPHLPTDLGFYDLRVRETRRDQIKMAKDHGIDGFCYHYYWFSGKRILNRPLDDMLSDQESDMPFCLCWANENWTRRWDAAEHEVLIAQKYLPDDDTDFIKSLVPFFEDERYIRVDDKPILIVYRPQHLPDAGKTIEIWREFCRKNGVGEIFLCAALTHGNENYADYGFDAGVEFPPHNMKSANVNSEIAFYQPFVGNVMDYATVAQSYLSRTYDGGKVFKTIFPSWDNTARVNNRALLFLNGEPDNYEFWLSSTLDLAAKQGDEIVFVNAWNEWAEGCHLEPDREFGHGFLLATKSAKMGARRFSEFPNKEIPVVIRENRRIFFADLSEVLAFHIKSAFENIQSAVLRRPLIHRVLLPFVRVLRSFRKLFS
ncbi:glycoside hydrolase family 99-like domain-containing protein [Diaphorobacter sp. C33]|uniref:Glycosyl transferase family WbsX n=1 Tax=Diaphorobacter nitroreducens TaxID=164759 RepID=A0AAX1WYV6_9BURK|nr:glycoside hydrolase family 99-like domain-containing protein [Diaphorobacter sp. C33]ROR50659.1 glycosyl transferase family WbsX [Diaphorobacter nitroreducens]WKK89583.1 glycoside hydrolase family 99-like domain-containing protein [Diaphorobacter sp. C33]